MTAANHEEQNARGSDGGASLVGTSVLIVDDDGETRRLLTRFLKGHGYNVTAVTDGRAMYDALAALPVDLIVLDVMLPGTDGLDLCRAVRNSSAVPIIMLTAKRDDTDRIVGLEMGADDYLPKPFNPRELLARMKAVLRRTSAAPGAVRSANTRVFEFESWRLDSLRRTLTNPAGVIVDLSAGEYDLLLAFLEAPQRVLSRDHLLEVARNRTATGFDRSIDTQVSRLRRKLDTGDESDGPIKTVRGVGYMFLPTVSRT